MKKLLLSLFALMATSVFCQDDLVCGVYLIELKTNEAIAHKVMIQNTHGISVGTNEGYNFHIESTKKRFLKKSLITSSISFWMMLDTGTNTGTFQFYRDSNPNKYDILTKHDTLGEKIVVKAFEEKFDIIDEKYAVKSYCNIKS